MSVAATFGITERDDPDQARRLTITGELDLASTAALEERLRELGRAHRRVRLDLSQLDFIDSTGISTILLGLSDSAREGWQLEIDPVVSPQAARVITISGLAGKFWPPSPS